MEVEKILLNFQEKRLLWKIERHEISISTHLTANKQIGVLISFGLVEPCLNSRFAPAMPDEYGNEMPNAYQITDKAVRYRLYRRAKFWFEFRAWFTLAIALSAFIKSFFF